MCWLSVLSEVIPCGKHGWNSLIFRCADVSKQHILHIVTVYIYVYVLDIYNVIICMNIYISMLVYTYVVYMLYILSMFVYVVHVIRIYIYIYIQLS